MPFWPDLGTCHKATGTASEIGEAKGHDANRGKSVAILLTGRGGASQSMESSRPYSGHLARDENCYKFIAKVLPRVANIGAVITCTIACKITKCPITVNPPLSPSQNRPPPPPRGPLPNSVPAPHQRPPRPPPRPSQRVDRPPPPPGRRNVRPPQRDQVIGHQVGHCRSAGEVAIGQRVRSLQTHWSPGQSL